MKHWARRALAGLAIGCLIGGWFASDTLRAADMVVVALWLLRESL